MGGAAFAKKLHHGVDIIQLASCRIPDYAATVLTSGGLVLVEPMKCEKPHLFKQFLDQALKLGSVMVARRIAVIIKKGIFKLDPRRAVWPHQSTSTAGGKGAQAQMESKRE